MWSWEHGHRLSVLVKNPIGTLLIAFDGSKFMIFYTGVNNVMLLCGSDDFRTFGALLKTYLVLYRGKIANSVSIAIRKFVRKLV